MSWQADIVNNPMRDYDLDIQILKDGEEIAVIQRIDSELLLKVYPSEKEIDIPIDWLIAVLKKAEKI